jgi:hypothetical protein
LLMCSTRTLNYAPKEEQKWMPHSTPRSTSKHARSQIVFCSQTPPICDSIRNYLPQRAQGTHKGHKV